MFEHTPEAFMELGSLLRQDSRSMTISLLLRVEGPLGSHVHRYMSEQGLLKQREEGSKCIDMFHTFLYTRTKPQLIYYLFKSITKNQIPIYFPICLVKTNHHL